MAEKKQSVKLKIKILLVDRSDALRSAVKNFFSANNTVEVTDDFADVNDARRKLGSGLTINAAIIEVSPVKPENAAFIRELAEKHSVPCIAIHEASYTVPEDLPVSDIVKKPRTRSEFASFGTLLSTKLILTAKVNNSGKCEDGAVFPVLNVKSHKGKVEPIQPTRDDISGLDKRTRDGYVVALGASTGGTDALECIIKTFPKTMPPVLVVQHMPPVFTKLYSERLNRCCAVHVKEAQDGDRLSQGLCLIAAGGAHMELKRDGRGYYVKCGAGEKVSGHCPSVDVLFTSVAETAGRKSIGALMTGMGADGAKGLLKMHRSGAYTIGQDKDSCVVYGMPMEAYKLGACSEQQPLENIGKTLCRRLTDGWN